MERRNDVPNLLAMYIRNTSEIYNITLWLQNCIIKKINKGVQPQVEHLANCSTMKTIIREAAKLLYKYDGITPTKQEKQEASRDYDGHKLPEKQVKRAYYNGTRTQNIVKLYRDTPELIKFVREHANDYNTLKRKDVPSCININRRRRERYFSVYIEKFGEISFKEVLNVFPLLPKSYLNNESD